MQRTSSNISFRLYELLLFAYPSDFRRVFGPEMLQVFRDCYRAEQQGSRIGTIFRLWLHTLSDLIVSAAKERGARENSFMNTLKKDLVGIFGFILIIALALFLLSYGRKHDAAWFVVLGYFLDALVSAGVVGNIIVFLLAKTAKLNSFRVALRTFLVVHAALLIVIAVIAVRDPSPFNALNIVTAYIGSFLFWIGVHFVWAKSTQNWSHPEVSSQ